MDFMQKKDCDDKNKKDKRSGLLTGIVVGGAIGSVASLMLSSKKGRETSKNLGKKVGKEVLSTGLGLLKKFVDRKK